MYKSTANLLFLRRRACVFRALRNALYAAKWIL